MHAELAGVVRQLLEFQEFKLNTEWGVFDLECPGDPLIWNELMNGTAEPVFVALRVCCFKLITAVPFVLKLQHFGSHPLLEDIGFHVGPEEQVERQIKLPGN